MQLCSSSLHMAYAPESKDDTVACAAWLTAAACFLPAASIAHAALTINDNVYMINTGPESGYDGTNNGQTNAHTSQVQFAAS